MMGPRRSWQNHAVLWCRANRVSNMGNRDLKLNEAGDVPTDVNQDLVLRFGVTKWDCSSSIGCLLGQKCRKRDQATSTRNIVVQVGIVYRLLGLNFPGRRSWIIRFEKWVCAENYVPWRSLYVIWSVLAFVSPCVGNWQAFLRPP